MSDFLKEKENKKKNRKKISLNIFNKILFLVIIVLGVYYVTGVNDLTVKGFKLQELKLSAMEVNDDNSKFELDILTLGSYNNLGERIENLEMVAVGEIEYVSGASGVVAKR